MAVVAAKTAYGYVFTCTGGTGVASVLVNKGTFLPVIGVHFIGANTADIVTVNDADGNQFAKGYGSTGLSNSNISFAKPVRVDGLQVGCAGATTGAVIVYCA